MHNKNRIHTTGSRIIEVLAALPEGRVASYGQVAAIAGIPNGARTVARILHAASASRGLPWWRVIRKDGSIALPRGAGYEEQKARLEEEGVSFGLDGRVDPECWI